MLSLVLLEGWLVCCQQWQCIMRLFKGGWEGVVPQSTAERDKVLWSKVWFAGDFQFFCGLFSLERLVQVTVFPWCDVAGDCSCWMMGCHGFKCIK